MKLQLPAKHDAQRSPSVLVCRNECIYDQRNTVWPVCSWWIFSGYNRQIQGSLIKTERYGWQIHLHPTTILQGDDVAIVIDLFEENLAGTP